jgi:5'-nucleotidase
MTSTHRRTIGAGIAVTAVAALVAATPALAAESTKPAAKKSGTQTVQLLSINDYHGNLEALSSMTFEPEPRAALIKAGGAENLATKLAELREEAGDANSLTVAAGDLIGGSAFISGMFHDEPSVESLNAMGMDVSSVGNHEFDEGTEELLRMQRGGCHPSTAATSPTSPTPVRTSPGSRPTSSRRPAGSRCCRRPRCRRSARCVSVSSG